MLAPAVDTSLQKPAVRRRTLSDRRAACVLVCALLALGAQHALADRRSDRIEPWGIWSCVLYDDPVRGDQRLLLSVGTDGAVHLALQSASSVSLWRPALSSSLDGDELSFVDGRTSRRFEADLERSRLAGSWSSGSATGGWWCEHLRGASSDPLDVRRSPTEFFVPQLVPHSMVSPAYPRKAIREATEGRVVACFLVDASGTVFEPELVEVSDQIFAEPTLEVLVRTRYNTIEQSDTVRFGCRSYLYQLDAVY